ncbi:hypothetical protein FQR65_LT15724 [Abscondita terminalis]|nr:hypothetical protein FQR65_LT15724 [Abscondita terminalis]
MDKKRCTNFRYDEVDSVDLVERNKEILGLINYFSWNPEQLRQPKNKVLQLPTATIESSSGMDSVSDELGVAEGTIDNPQQQCRSTIYKLLEEEKSNRAAPIATKLQKRRSGVYEELARKKLNLLNFK